MNCFFDFLQSCPEISTKYGTKETYAADCAEQQQFGKADVPWTVFHHYHHHYHHY